MHQIRPLDLSRKSKKAILEELILPWNLEKGLSASSSLVYFMSLISRKNLPDFALCFNFARKLNHIDEIPASL
jgi:hypothetical protein